MLLFVKFRVSGHSMEPSIGNGKKVFVSSVPFYFSKPKPGDIIAFKKDRKVLIKRISGINNEKYFVKGDNHKDSFDSRRFGFIRINDILGKVVYVLR